MSSVDMMPNNPAASQARSRRQPTPDRSSPVRWAILGAASIARGQFMPALRESGSGRTRLIASRDLSRAEAFAAAEGVEEASSDYRAALESPEVDAVYIALPNSHHAEWTIAALEAGKAVLCEKPLCASVEDTRRVLEVARARADALLWEAFVFPFQAQHQRLVELVDGGAIGDPAEVSSAFHFRVTRPDNIRLSAELGGGALADVGCYPIRLAFELLGPADGDVGVDSRWGREVEVDAAGFVSHGDGRRLVLTCGLERGYDTFTRILGDAGQLHLTNPFHPEPGDLLTLHRPGQDAVVERPTTDAHSFTAALRHIHAVVRGEEPPRHLAVGSALPVATTLAALQQAARR
jgi:predicted dehydrogenase